MRIYVTAPESDQPRAPPPLATGLATTIEPDSSGSPTHDLYFNGTIDEVAVYNTALSAQSDPSARLCPIGFGQGQPFWHSQFQ